VVRTQINKTQVMQFMLFFKVHGNRVLLFGLLAFATCFLAKFFIFATPVEAAIPPWYYSVKSINYDSKYTVQACLQNVTAAMLNTPSVGNNTNAKGNAVESVSGNNMIINICVDRGNRAPALVTFITNGTTTAERDRMAQAVNKALYTFVADLQ
jgi:hypothetical protein